MNRDTPLLSRTGGHRTCSGCGATYARGEWRALGVLQRIASPEVSRILRDWPESAFIEVRGCARCGRAIAGKGSALDT